MKKLSLLLVVVLLCGAANALPLVLSDDFEGPAVGQPLDPSKWLSIGSAATIGGDASNQYAVLDSNAVASNTGSIAMASVDYDFDTLTVSDGSKRVVTVGLSAAAHSSPIFSMIVQNYGAVPGDVLQYAWIAHGGGAIWLDNPPIAGDSWNHWEFSVTMDPGYATGKVSVTRDGNVLCTDAPFTSYAPIAPGSVVMYGTGLADNVNIYAPEPATMVLLGLGGLLLRRRR
ncbi:MAG: PEP-CTERM sorting domain-containing protein [Planctomycetota bacterium]